MINNLIKDVRKHFEKNLKGYKDYIISIRAGRENPSFV